MTINTIILLVAVIALFLAALKVQPFARLDMGWLGMGWLGMALRAFTVFFGGLKL